MSIANLTTTLDWTVTEQQISDNIGEVEGFKTLRRSDNNFVLNVCRNSYTVYPNEELVRLATEIEEVSNGAYKLEGFGEWQGGGIVMAQLKQEHSIGLCGWDDENYMLLGNGHNGQRAFFIGHINRLVRCSNQFGSISTKLRVPHTSGIMERSKSFGKIVKLYTDRQQHMREILERGYDVKIDRKLITACIDHVLEVDKHGGRQTLAQNARQLSREWSRAWRERWQR